MHFSLDVWNTLFKPNKTEYPKLRAMEIANVCDIPERAAVELYRQAKGMLDDQARWLGKGSTVTENWVTLVKMIGLWYPTIASNEWPLHRQNVDGLAWAIQRRCTEHFLEYRPTILPETVEVIQSLQEQGHTFCITSNTNFISGKDVHQVLTESGIDIKLSDCRFSDMIGMSKPHPMMFRMVLADKNVLSSAPSDVRNEFLHIGDDPSCDHARGIIPHRIISGVEELPTVLAEYLK